MRAPYDGVVLAAPFTLARRRHAEGSTVSLAAAALAGVLRAAGLRHALLDGLSLASHSLGGETVATVADQLGLSCRYLDQPMLGGASAIAAVRRAARMVAAGDIDTVAIIAADRGEGPAALPDFTLDALAPYGGPGALVPLALLTQNYMRRFGATRADCAKICLAARENAAGVPHALLGATPLTEADYEDAPMLADPLVTHDRPQPVAGAAGCLLMREIDAVAGGLPYARILATIERHGAYRGDLVQTRGGWAREIGELWSMAGLRPGAVDVVETHDACPILSMIQFEDLGFCAKGDGPAFVREHGLTRTGSFPHNTAGGLLAGGEPGAAAGHYGLVEALRQVTGTAAEGDESAPVSWQVPGASVGLVSAFGVLPYDRGLAACAAILAGRGAEAAP
ncbi:thiolase family protein [Acuticoccus kandeliae]|uniref:thiolase family protein n=1 Tax=Acuticoccus kandeliae TaxID=2073160 RepID=UPI000D3E1F2E|nr:thiolase family protein [Acuticoccus kandeliae]